MDSNLESIFFDMHKLYYPKCCTLELHDIARLILYCLNIQDNKRSNIYIQFSIQYQDSGVKNVKNLALS